MLMNKKNTFHDFIDSAEYLVKEKWTSSDRLIIEGASAGGLLVGAVVNDAARSVSRRPGGGAVRRRDEYDAGCQLAADRWRVPGVGRPATRNRPTTT